MSGKGTAGPLAGGPSPVRVGFLLALLLALAFTVLWTARARFWRFTLTDEPAGSLGQLVLDAVPRQVRRLGADFLWLRADEYMHFGPSRRYRGAFLAGSFAANTEILPLLELAIRLDPAHFEAYGILAENLALYLDRFVPAVRTLQEGILANRDHPGVHELYGSIAYCYGFVKSYDVKKENDRRVALRYLDAALAAAARAGVASETPGQTLNPVNYQVMRARFLVEQGRRDEALAAWMAAGQPLGPAGGLLGDYLGRVAAGEPVPALPEDLRPDPVAGRPGVSPGGANGAFGRPGVGDVPAREGPGGAGLAPVPTVPDPRAGFPFGTGPAGGVPSGSSANAPAGEGQHGDHDHAPGETCTHEPGTCPHQQQPPPLLDRAKVWREAYMQMALLGLAGLAMMTFARR
ncbi:MAG: hypothetical protein GX442_11620 [Candidatus Riflebacteria bacterium]|nr:hypothetical protein [Candidatus Riflebacteria bacterium]